jgi:hypothetical protein
MSSPDYIPRSDKAEWHLTYRCDLACFLPPQTPDMTLDDARDFCRQADALGWRPRITLIGGEPTLHRNFAGFLDLARHFTGDGRRVEIYSNGYGPRARELLAEVRGRGLAIVQEGTIKTGSVDHPVRDIFLAPRDFGRARAPCPTHSSFTDPDCGISVDARGYTLCCMGGAIDGFLELGLRTYRLADLFDPEFAAYQTRELCDHCGQHLGLDPACLEKCQQVHGAWMSPSWQEAATRAIEGQRHKGT